MVPLIQENMSAQNQQAQALKSKAQDGKIVSEQVTVAMPLQVGLKVHGHRRPINGAIIILRIFLNLSGSLPKVQRVRTNGNQKTTKV